MLSIHLVPIAVIVFISRTGKSSRMMDMMAAMMGRSPSSSNNAGVMVMGSDGSMMTYGIPDTPL